jgi:HK97 family phage prohead protease
MPWHLESDNPRCSGWAVVQNDNGKVVGCHKTKADAQKQLAALNINVASLPEPATSMQMADIDNSAWDGNRAMTECQSASDYNKVCAGTKAGDSSLRSSHALPHHYLGKYPAPNADGVRAALQRFSMTQGLTNSAEARSHLEGHMTTIQNQSSASEPPKENLVRALDHSSYELRHEGDGPPLLMGYFARFNEWTEIDSLFEGHFMERIAPGAFTESFAELTPKVLFQHGKDPQIGDKVLGAPSLLEEDNQGARYEVPLLDTSYVRDLIPGLDAGLYGASFRFAVRQETFDRSPEKSDYNPDAIPERTVVKARVPEFGPVTFPAYAGATAGLRSMTDEFLLEHFLESQEGRRKLVEVIRSTGSVEDKPPEDKPRIPPGSSTLPRHAEWMAQRKAGHA